MSECWLMFPISIVLVFVMFPIEIITDFNSKDKDQPIRDEKKHFFCINFSWKKQQQQQQQNKHTHTHTHT